MKNYTSLKIKLKSGTSYTHDIIYVQGGERKIGRVRVISSTLHKDNTNALKDRKTTVHRNPTLRFYPFRAVVSASVTHMVLSLV